jgi:hypothetical protein
LSPNLLRGRGRGKSIGRDLDVDEEGFEQNFEPLQSLHHYSMWKAPNRTLNPCNHYTTSLLVINPCGTQIDLTKKANPHKRNPEHKQNEVDAI